MGRCRNRNLKHVKPERAAYAATLRRATASLQTRRSLTDLPAPLLPGPQLGGFLFISKLAFLSPIVASMANFSKSVHRPAKRCFVLGVVRNFSSRDATVDLTPKKFD